MKLIEVAPDDLHLSPELVRSGSAKSFEDLNRASLRMIEPRVGSLFSGALGLDLAVQRVIPGASLAWACDTSTEAKKLLAFRAPDAPNLGDISEVDWSQVEPVDVLSFGWPCQPFSIAGKKGVNDVRALWPEVARAVRILRPRLLIGENVPGILTRSSGPEIARVVGELAGLGYVGSWGCLAAADIGAPHLRRRVFLAAHTNSEPASRRLAPAEAAKSGAFVAGGGRPEKAGDFRSTLERWERLTRPRPSAAIINERGEHRLSPRFVEWMMGFPDGWICDVPGMSSPQALQLCGNAVVPQQAAAAITQLIKRLDQARPGLRVGFHA